MHVTLVIIKAERETWLNHLSQWNNWVRNICNIKFDCAFNTTFWTPQFKRYHPWSMRWNSALLNVLQMYLVLVVQTDVRTPSIRTCCRHWSTVQHKPIPQIVCTSCDWCHWSTHHAEDPSWSLLNIEFLNQCCCLRSRRCGCCTWCNWTRRRTRNFLHSLHISLPTLTRLVSPFSTCSAVAFETGICSWFLVFSLSFSFAFLSFFSSFLTAFAVIVPLAVFITFVVLSQFFTKFSFSIALLASVSFLALHCSDFHRHWTMTIILSFQIIHQCNSKSSVISSILNSQIRPDWSWWSWQHNCTFQSVTEHFTCRLLEVNNLIFPFQQSLIESICGSKVVFQQIRVLVQRRPSRRSILFAQFAPALKATLVSYCFHHIQSLVLAHHDQTHVQRFVRLSAIRDRFPKLHRWIRCLVQPFLSCVVEETKPVTKYPLEVPPFSSVSREIWRFAKQLGIHSRRSTASVRRTADVTNVSPRKSQSSASWDDEYDEISTQIFQQYSQIFLLNVTFLCVVLVIFKWHIRFSNDVIRSFVTKHLGAKWSYQVSKEVRGSMITVRSETTCRSVNDDGERRTCRAEWIVHIDQLSSISYSWRNVSKFTSFEQNVF